MVLILMFQDACTHACILCIMLLQVEKEKEGLRMELNKARGNINEAESAIATQKAQLEKLNHVVAEADAGGRGRMLCCCKL
jgi:septal ring factor EnvC (AmiA/AmiB activator)